MAGFALMVCSGDIGRGIGNSIVKDNNAVRGQFE
jgi:hypothetical protein